MATDAFILDPNDPGRILIPQPHQLALAISAALATFLAGGWGSGKTLGLLLFLFVSAFENPGGTAGMVVLPTYPLLTEFLDTQLLPSFSPIIKHHAKGKRCLYLLGNRRLLYRSGHIPERLELSNLCYLGVDEAGMLDSGIFLRGIARIRDKRATRLRVALTGVPYWGWLRDEFEGRDDETRRIIHCSTAQNVHLHPDAVRNLEDACPARLRRMFLEGHFTTPGGTVYPEYDRERHVIPWEHDKYLPCGCAIDWSPRTPAVLWVQLLPEGYQLPSGARIPKEGGIVVFDELHPDGTDVAITTERLCSLVKSKGWPIEWAVVDPAGTGAQATSGLAETYIARQHLGVPLKMKTDAKKRRIQTGIEYVKRLLDPLRGPPLLYFAESLTKTREARAVLNAIRAYGYPKGKDGKPLSPEPVKDGITDHAMDLLRYLAINFYTFARLEGSRVWSRL